MPAHCPSILARVGAPGAALLLASLLAAACSGDAARTSNAGDAGQVLSDTGTPDAPDAGTPGVSDGDTPGEEPLVEGAVVLNEVGCRQGDFVELYNPSAASVDLTGWRIGETPDPSAAHALAPGVLLPGQWHLVRQVAEDPVGFSFGIRCGQDSVYLFDASGQLKDTLEVTQTFSSAATHGRLPDGGAWDQTTPTPGGPNAPFAVEGPDAWFQHAEVRRLEVTIPQSSLDKLAQEPRKWTRASLALPAEGIAPLEIGIRLKGQWGSFRTLDGKAAFRVDLNCYVDGQTLYGLDELTLNNMVQDPSKLREFAAYHLFGAMGVPAPRVTWVALTVNGEDFGLYLSVEGYDAQMLARWFPSTGHLYEGAYGQDLFLGDIPALDVDEGDSADLSDITSLAELLERTPIEQVYQQTQDRVDWPVVTAFLATEVWIGHWDGYGPTRNNYHFHFDRAGRLTVLPWGADQSFGWGWPIHEGSGLLLQACRADAACAANYYAELARVARLAAETGLSGLIAERAGALRAHVERDPRLEHDLGAFDATVQATRDFLEGRTAELATELACLSGPNADPDGDGALCAMDCAPNDASIRPGATDICGDGIDQDCNGWADDDLSCPDCQPIALATGNYLICPTPRTFADARAHCEAQGARLVQIDSDQENALVYGAAMAMRDQWWWLGLWDAPDEGRFEWLDGTPLGWSMWAPGEPNDSGGVEDCVHFFGTPEWNDIDCEVAMGVLCELP